MELDAFETREQLANASVKSAVAMSGLIKKFRKTFVWPMDDQVNEVAKSSYESLSANKKQVINQKEYILIARRMGAISHHMVMGAVPKFLSLFNSCNRLSSSSNGISEDINEMRGIVERFSALDVTKNKIMREINSSRIVSFEDLVKASGVMKDLLGTRFNWNEYQLTPFEEMGKRTEYKAGEESIWNQDFSSQNILGTIDKADKNLAGLRAYYNFCSEFVHPNIGDLISCTCDKSFIDTIYNQVAVETRYCKNPLDPKESKSSYAASRFLLSDTFRFGVKVVERLPELAIFYEDILSSGARENKKTHTGISKMREVIF